MPLANRSTAAPIAPRRRHPGLVLGGVGPGGHGHQLDQRVAVAEGGLVICHRGDHAAIALQAACRQQRGIAVAVAVVAAAQEGRDRLVVELAQLVALAVAPQQPWRCVWSSMVCSSRYDSSWTRSATTGGVPSRSAASNLCPWSGSPTQT